jgi:hypothetical protein
LEQEGQFPVLLLLGLILERNIDKGSAYFTRETRNRFGSKQVEMVVGDMKPAAGEEPSEALDARPNFFFVAGNSNFAPAFDQVQVSHDQAATLRCHSGRALWKTDNDGVWKRVMDLNGLPLAP